MNSRVPGDDVDSGGGGRWPVVVAAIVGGAIGGAIGGYAGAQAGSENGDAPPAQEQPQD